MGIAYRIGTRYQGTIEMTTREEKNQFAHRYSDAEWMILAANPRFINALNESMDEADQEARRILADSSRPAASGKAKLFPDLQIRPIGGDKPVGPTQ